MKFIMICALIVLVFSLSTTLINSQYCYGVSQYGRCSTNSACACFYDAGATDVGICLDQSVDCSELVTCNSSNNECYEPSHRCVQHPRCNSRSVCYPVPSFNQRLCPPLSVIPELTTTTTATVTTRTTTATTTRTTTATTTKTTTAITTKTTTRTTTATATAVTTVTTTAAATATVASTPAQPLAQQLFPLRCPSILHLTPQVQWEQKGSTVAGGSILGNGLEQLQNPFGLHVDDDYTLYVADYWNHRIMEWKQNATVGTIVAGGNGRGSGLHQLSNPTDVIVDKTTDSLVICDSSNSRVLRWSRKNATRGEIVVSNITCMGLTMDESGSLYVVDTNKDAVRRYRNGESQGTLVAGGNGRGSNLDQLNLPTYVFVDTDHSIYVSEEGNHRVMKWTNGAKQGTLVAGGDLTWPQGVVVDRLGTVYIADRGNSRIMRWPRGATQGTAIVDGNSILDLWSLPSKPTGLSFDRDGNLYAADWANHRVRKFNIKPNS